MIILLLPLLLKARYLFGSHLANAEMIVRINDFTFRYNNDNRKHIIG